MSRFVLDASVALKWVLQEPERQRALDLREQFLRGMHELLAPDIFIVEVGHVLSKLHRQRKLSETDAEAYLAEILSSPPQLYSSLSLMTRAFEMSLDTRKSLYDCFYPALAEQEGCRVITADRGMIIDPNRVIHIADL